MTSDDFFQQVQNHLKEELPLVVYRRPDGRNGIRAFLQKSAEINISRDFTESGFVFSPFDERNQTIIFPADLCHFLEMEVLEDEGTENSVTGEDQVLLQDVKAKEKHLRLVEKSMMLIQAGEFKKVVLSRKEKMKLPGKDPLQIFRNLVQNYPTAFAYFWYHPQIGQWFGASPETLVQADGFEFKTMALAGTQKFNDRLDVEWGAKEKQEQQYVTDAILQGLKELENVEQLKYSEPFTTRAGGLLHIRTDISGKMRISKDIGKIIQKLHPTPAVCGLPKQEAKEFILREEGYDREYYTGFLGELNLQEKKRRARSRRNTENLAYASIKKSTALFVNLRCMKMSGNTAEIFVGGGITADSHPEEEWQETQHKAETMKNVLGR